jgi:glutathione S-transferase
MSRPELVSLSYSPWSEKARWALDYHAIDYDKVAYTPMISTPGLRLRLRSLRGKVTVPILFDGDTVLRDSFDIARYADVHGTGSPLIPVSCEGDVMRWVQLGEEALAAARVLVTARIANDSQAKKESVPRLVPGFLKGSLANMGIRYFERKYALGECELTAQRETVRHILNELGRCIEAPESLLCGDGFTFADIAMAVVLQAVVPVDERYIRLGEGTRRCWRDDQLADEFGDLVAWRDELYARFR